MKFKKFWSVGGVRQVRPPLNPPLQPKDGEGNVFTLLCVCSEVYPYLADTDNAITNFHNGIFFSYFVNFQKCVWDQSSIQKQLYFKCEQIL